MAGVAHVVQFKFHEHHNPGTIQEVCEKMLALQQNCIHPTTGKPYITAARGGKEMYIEGKHHNFTHIFVVEFASVEDRDYYALEDPYHLEFGKYMDKFVKEAQEVDFAVGIF